MFLPQQASLPAGIHAFARQQALVMNTEKPRHLQFKSIDNGKLLYNVRIYCIIASSTRLFSFS
jgi:hypothetical protein